MFIWTEEIHLLNSKIILTNITFTRAFESFDLKPNEIKVLRVFVDIYPMLPKVVDKICSVNYSFIFLQDSIPPQIDSFSLKCCKLKTTGDLS